MSGYCPDCGNTLCVCKSVIFQLEGDIKAIKEKPPKVYCVNAVEHDVRCEGLEIKYTDALKMLEEMAGALEQMVFAAREKNCGLKIADDALESYRKLKGE